jgi:hypothetical protein
MTNLLSLSRVLVLMMGMFFLSTNPGCGGAPPADEPGTPRIDGGSSSPDAAEDRIVTMQKTINSLQKELIEAQGKISTSQETLRLALSPRDGRLWRCESTNGSPPFIGHWSSEAKIEPQGNTLVIGFTTEGQSRETLFCPANGSLAIWKTGSFVCTPVGNDPLTCTLVL